MIVDGRKIAKELVAEVRKEVAVLPRAPRVRAVSVSPSPATESYLAVKERRAKQAGMALDIVRLPATATTEEIVDAFAGEADALLVQLPLPASIDTERVLDAIPLALDADVLSLASRTAYAAQEPGALLPPVVDAIAEVCARHQVNLEGVRAVVIGNGWLVGAPAARWLAAQGAHVEVLTRDDADFSKLKDAQVIVSGAGSPGIIRPEQLSPGVVLIDAGTSESDGSIVGDADPACAEVASVFTPVPGGIGPIAVACLLRNALILAKRGRLQAR